MGRKFAMVTFGMLVAMMLATFAAGRELLQARGPPRCERLVPSNNNLGIDCGGVDGQWDRDEIECTFGGYELKCDYDSEIGTDQAECSLDVPGIGNDKNFDCPIRNGRATCDYGALALPSEAESRVRLIFDTWCTQE